MQRLHTSKLAEVALERYDLGGARLQSLRRGFIQAFKVTSQNKGEFVLRMYSVLPDDSGAKGGTTARLRSPDTLRAQLEWLLSLGRETDLLVPEPVPTSDGLLMDYVSFDHLPFHRKLLRPLWRRHQRLYSPQRAGRLCVLLRWVPGKHKRDNALAPADLYLLGSYVAGLHDHARRYQAPEDTVLSRWDWEWAFGKAVPLWSRGEAHYSPSEMEVFRETARSVREDLEHLGEECEVFGVIHRDIKLENVVFDGQRVGVIDFEMCGWGYYLSDLSVIRRSLAQHYKDRLEPLWEAFLEGYQGKRPLPEDYARQIEAFDAMQRAAIVNRHLVILEFEADRHKSRAIRILRNNVAQLRRNYLEDKG
jgi:Ser/Thr protein kinase RdoA (MazF antagonist)